jgi:hypothetical protein
MPVHNTIFRNQPADNHHPALPLKRVGKAVRMTAQSNESLGKEDSKEISSAR